MGSSWRCGRCRDTCSTCPPPRDTPGQNGRICCTCSTCCCCDRRRQIPDDLRQIRLQILGLRDPHGHGRSLHQLRDTRGQNGQSCHSGNTRSPRPPHPQDIREQSDQSWKNRFVRRSGKMIFRRNDLLSQDSQTKETSHVLKTKY